MGNVTALMMDVITEKSGHTMTGLAVSVCLTPAAPAPLPLPYPTIATVSEGVIDECLRTKIDGAKVLTVGSCTKSCHGNEPGTLKEIVSLNTAGPSFPILGAPIVFIELGMAGITLSPGFMNKNPLPGIGGSASGAGGGGGGGGGAGGGAGGPPGSSTSGPSNGGGGGGGSNSGAAPPNAPAPPGAEGQANAGHPIDVVTGAMFTGPIIDFTLPGFFVIQHTRSYSTSAVRRDVGMGLGWSCSLHWTARTEGETLILVDDEGRESKLGMPSGESAMLPHGRKVRRSGADVIVDLPDGLSRVLRADEHGPPNRLFLAELRDENGHVAEVEWEDGQVVGITDTVGRHARRFRDGQTVRWEATATDAEGREHRKHLVAYQVDERRQLASVIDAGGVETRFDYDEEGYLVTETRGDGLVWNFVYSDVGGRRLCVETWGDLPGLDVLALLGDPDAGGSRRAKGVYHARVEYGPEPYQSTVRDALGHVHRYWGNAFGLVTRYQDPRGVDHLYTYGPTGTLVRQTHGGVTEARRVDGVGRITGVSGPGGEGLYATFNAEKSERTVHFSDGLRMVQKREGGKVTEVTDPLGRLHKTRYNEHGQVASKEGPGAVHDEIGYDAHGNVATYTTATGAAWKYTWDLFGLPVRIETPSGGVYELKYGSRGEIAVVTTPGGQTCRRGYDPLGRLILTEHGGGGTSTQSYVADAKVEQSAPDGTRWRMGYDALLRMRWIENPAGERCRFDYDEAGNLVHEVSFSEIATEYEFDAVRRVYLARRGDGSSVRLTRDPAGRIVRREHSNGQVESYAYDASGSLSRAVNEGSEVSFLRDERGRLLRETQRAGGWEFAIDYEHNALGQVTNRRYSTGWGIASTPSDVDGTITSMEVTTRAGTESFAFEYDKGGRETARRRGSGKGAILTERNVLGLPEKVTVLAGEDTVVRERSYTWSKQGPLARVSDEDGGERTYELDVMGRPLAVSGLGTSESYGYTPMGIPVPTNGDVAMARGSRPIRAGDAQLTWDVRGRLAGRACGDPARSWRYSYDDDNQMIEAVRGDGREVEYVYDALGRRLAETSGGASTWFGWEGDTQVEEVETGGRRTRRVFGPDCFSPILEGNEDGMRLVATDAVGTPWLLVDARGEAASLELTAWGAVAKSEGDVTALRFGGQRADALTGLSYNRNRYYDPELRVFTTPDPLGFRVTPNEVGFVPNTTYHVDPLGLLIIVQASDDPVVESSADRIQAANPGSTIIRASDLQPNSLSGESQVAVVSHGTPGSIEWVYGHSSGAQVATALNNAGFNGRAPGAQVSMVVCNGATPATAGPSVAQAVANGTGAQTFGALSNDTAATQARTRTPVMGNPGYRAPPGVMAVAGDGTARVHDGRFGSVQPQAAGAAGPEVHTPSGSPATATTEASSGLFGP